MHSNCVLDSVANLLVRHMVFVGNVQKSPIASHLKGLDSSLDLFSITASNNGYKLKHYYNRAYLTFLNHFGNIHNTNIGV